MSCLTCICYIKTGVLIRRPKIWPSETPCHWKRLFREHIIQPDQTGKLEWSMSTDVVDDRWMFFDVSFSLGGLYLLYPPLCAALLCLCWFHRTHSLPACLVCHFLLPAIVRVLPTCFVCHLMPATCGDLVCCSL